MIIIAAIGDNHVLGKDNKLPWNLPNDLKRFSKLTRYKATMMGRKTFESLPPKYRPLPDRLNIVITRDRDWHPGGEVIVVHSIEEAIRAAREAGKELFVIGGEQIYKLALPYADELLITRVRANVDGDAFFPEIHPHEWKLTEEDPQPRDEKHKYEYIYRKYISRRTGL